MSMEEADVVAYHEEPIPDCEQLKESVLKILQPSVVKLRELCSSLTDRWLILESEAVKLRMSEVGMWETQYLVKHGEVDCHSEGFERLKLFRPSSGWSSETFTITWTARELQNQIIELKGRVYLHRNYKGNSRQGQKNSYALHRLLHQLNFQTLPLMIPKCHLHPANRLNSPFVLPGQILRLPLRCSFEQFVSQKYFHTEDLSFPGLSQKSKLYFTLTPQTQWLDFLHTRERYPMYQWLCHPLEGSPQSVLCPYNLDLREVRNTPDTALRGGVIFGDAGQGKTYAMIQYIISQIPVDKPLGKTLYIVQPYDRRVIEHTRLLRENDTEDIGIYWEWKDFAKIDEESFSRQHLIIVNAKFLSRSSLMRGLLIQLENKSCHRVIVDHYDCIDPRTKLHKFLTEVPTHILWLITSKLCVNLLPCTYGYLRLDRCFPDVELGREYSTMAMVFFRNLVFNVMAGAGQNPLQKSFLTSQTTLSRSRPRSQSVRYLVECPRRDQYPYEQVQVALRDIVSSSNSNEAVGLLSLLAAMDSGVPLEKKSVDQRLLTYSANRRAGGQMYRELLPYDELQVQVIRLTDKKTQIEDFCGICRDILIRPVKNKVCRHLFCYDCMKEWNTINSSCPQCRGQYLIEFYRIENESQPALKKRRVDDVSKKITAERKYLPESELYHEVSRERYLNYSLRQKLHDKVLVITHWKPMLHCYAEVAEKVLTAMKVEEPVLVLSSPILYTKSTQIDADIDAARVVVIHHENVMYFRMDDRFEQVFFMDSNGCPEGVEHWYNNFRHCVSRVYCYTKDSLDQMYFKKANQLLKRQRGFSSNVLFPQNHAAVKLSNYYHYLVE